MTIFKRKSDGCLFTIEKIVFTWCVCGPNYAARSYPFTALSGEVVHINNSEELYAFERVGQR